MSWDAFWLGFLGGIVATAGKLIWRSTSLRRLGRDFAVFWRLAELRGVLACARVEARTGVNAGDAAVMAVGAFALLFVLAVVQGDASPVLAEQHDATTLTPPARATGARQQECEAQEAPGPQQLVTQCAPWV